MTDYVAYLNRRDLSVETQDHEFENGVPLEILTYSEADVHNQIWVSVFRLKFLPGPGHFNYEYVPENDFDSAAWDSSSYTSR
jgi:hypothetical protein